MKLSKLIRELSVARDKLKVDPEVEIYTTVCTKEDIIKLEYVGLVTHIKYIDNPDSIRVVCRMNSFSIANLKYVFQNEK